MIKKTSDHFPISWPWDHKIELKEGFEPKSFKVYPLTPKEDEATKVFIEDNLQKGYIQPLKSPMATPIFYINKKDAKLRLCQDYKYLNKWTIKNAYPLPLITDLLDKLKKVKLFTKNWMYEQDTTMYKSGMATNEKLHSK